MSIERLAKAALAHRSPFLLEMRGSEDALSLHRGGGGQEGPHHRQG
ncbi:hypothetical protein [Streptomyces tailanensis]|nr:hypothetical protein [Streptomyces tailanensis]